MLMLGVVKIENPATKQVLMLEATGFDVVGFIFPAIRYAIEGLWTNAIICFLANFTVIGIVIGGWHTAFNFRKYRLESYIRKGWRVVTDEPNKKTA